MQSTKGQGHSEVIFLLVIAARRIAFIALRHPTRGGAKDKVEKGSPLIRCLCPPPGCVASPLHALLLSVVVVVVVVSVGGDVGALPIAIATGKYLALQCVVK